MKAWLSFVCIDNQKQGYYIPHMALKERHRPGAPGI